MTLEAHKGRIAAVVVLALAAALLAGLVSVVGPRLTYGPWEYYKTVAQRVLQRDPAASASASAQKLDASDFRYWRQRYRRLDWLPVRAWQRDELSSDQWHSEQGLPLPAVAR